MSHELSPGGHSPTNGEIQLLTNKNSQGRHILKPGAKSSNVFITNSDKVLQNSPGGTQSIKNHNAMPQLFYSPTLSKNVLEYPQKPNSGHELGVSYPTVSSSKLDAFRPYTLQEYKEHVQTNNYKYGGLGPNIRTEDWYSRKEKMSKMANFSEGVKERNLHFVENQNESQTGRPNAFEKKSGLRNSRVMPGKEGQYPKNHQTQVLTDVTTDLRES